MTSTYIPKRLREAVAWQARYRCGYCLSAENVVGFAMEIDHLIPQVLGGSSLEANLRLACPACNAFKGQRISARDPETGLTVRLFNPREQQWREHFYWIDSGARIIGKTSAGRATTLALHLNRPILVAARRAWIEAGWHPPAE